MYEVNMLFCILNLFLALFRGYECITEDIGSLVWVMNHLMWAAFFFLSAKARKNKTYE